MAEIIAGIVEGIAALIELTIHALAYLAKGSATLVLFCISNDYRVRKRIEWQNRPVRKVLALGFSGLCFATLCGSSIWLALFILGPSEPAKLSQQSDPPGSNHFSLNIHTSSRSGSNQTIQISIPEGGVGKILAATNRADLLTQIKSSMVINGSTNAAGTNLSPGRSFELKFGRTVNGN